MSDNVEFGVCDYCQKETYICSTPELGCYCKDCHKLVISNCKEAIKAINLKCKIPKTRMTPQKLDELKANADNALAALLGDNLIERK